MPALCPKCQTTLLLEQIPLRKDIRMICAACQSALTVSLVVTLESAPAAGVPASPASAAGALNAKKVVALVEGEATNEMMQEVLAEGGFELVSGRSGEDVIAQLVRERPGVVIADVGIPEVLGFEIAGRIRKKTDIQDIGVILLASIHDKTRYKREPESLYGADDYIERHHIQDQLLPKIQRILENRKTSAPSAGPRSVPETRSAEPTPTVADFAPPTLSSEKSKAVEQAMSIENVFDEMVEDERKQASSRPAVESARKSPVQAVVKGDPAAHEAAKRLARIIISDIALYNQRAIEEGVRIGSIYDLLRDEIEEGKRLYEGRVPSDIQASTNYYREAIDDFVNKRKLEMQKRS